MSRTFRKAAVCSLALALVTISAQASSAGGCNRSYRSHGHVQHTVVRHAPIHRHIVHRAAPLIVRPIVAVAPAPVVVRAARPIAPRVQRPAVPTGSTLSLPGNFLGPIAGHVFLVLDHVKVPARIENWTSNGVTITLPPMAVKHPTPARIDVIMPHGQAINKVKILLTPPAPLVLHPTAPATPLPTGPATPLLEAQGIPQIGAPVVQL